MASSLVENDLHSSERAHTMPVQIAIDGPVASGKGTVAAMLAKELGFTYLYTGAMYRALALACLGEHIEAKGEEDQTFKKNVLDILSHVDISVGQPSQESNQTYVIMLNGEDVSEEIKAPDVANFTPFVAAIPEVRVFMVQRQQELAQGKSVVMEGRDITTRVLPKADLKIFLNASLEERARRRWEELKASGVVKTFEEVLEDTKQRDEKDMTRATDPLQKLPDAWELDTTGMTQDQVVEAIKTELRKRNLL